MLSRRLRADESREIVIFATTNINVMGVAQIREELHQFINQADERILNLMYGMMKADAQKDEALESSIDKGLAQSNKGEVRPHKQVMSDIRTRYKS